MSNESRTSPSSISLDQLIALNDEIIALTRAGVPLDKGLIHLGSDLPGQLGRFATSLGYRLEAGENLSHVLSSSNASLPKTYLAVIEAGLRSGNLPSALEGIASSARRTAGLRKNILSATAYPLLILTVAYFLFLLSITRILPVMADAYADLTAYDAWILRQFQSLGANADAWWPLPLLGIYLLFAVWWYRSSRAETYQTTGWIPTMARLRSANRIAVFSDMLALMVKQDIPLHEAVRLSGQAAGGRGLQAATQEMSDRLASGTIRSAALPKNIPPLLGWTIVSGMPQAALSSTLDKLASGYQRKARQISNAITTYLPIFLSAGIGGSVVIAYALLILGPFVGLLYRASHPFTH